MIHLHLTYIGIWLGLILGSSNMSPHICKNLDLTVFTANMAGGICRREMTQKQAKDTKEKGQMKNAPAVGTFPKHLLCTQLCFLLKIR